MVVSILRLLYVMIQLYIYFSETLCNKVVLFEVFMTFLDLKY